MDNQTPPVQPITQQTIPPVSPPSNQLRNLGWLKWVLIVLIVALLSSGATYFVMNHSQQNQQPPQVVQTIPTPTPDPTVTWKTYTNVQYKFSIKHPATFEAEDKSSQFPPLTIFLTDKSRQVTTEGGVLNNPFVVLTVKQSQQSLIDYINDSKNNLTYINKKVVGENEFIVAEETLGMAAGKFGQYLIKKENNIVNIHTSLNGIEKETFNQILSTFKFTDQSL